MKKKKTKKNERVLKKKKISKVEKKNFKKKKILKKGRAVGIKKKTVGVIKNSDKKKQSLKKKVLDRGKPKNKKIKIGNLRTKVQKEKNIFDDVHKAKIRVVGIGGGGGSIISEIVSKIKKADFIAANTDIRALKSLSKKIKKFSFGQNLTNGLGTGMNPEIGETAALEEKERIKKIFEGQDLCIIVSCLGGGTASGATSVFAKIARSVGCMTYGIFTLPFSFEGEKKTEIAKNYLSSMKSNFNVFSVIPNESIFKIIDKNTPLQEALSAINKRLVDNLEGLIEMVYLPGLINIDFADLKTILSGYGKLAYLNSIEIDQTHKEEAARKVISTPLYSYTLKGARGILYNIVGGKSLSLSDVSRISEIISESVNKNAKIIFGISQEGKYKDKIKITLFGVGCGSKNELINNKAKIKKNIKKKKKKKIIEIIEEKKEQKLLENVLKKEVLKPELKLEPNLKKEAAPVIVKEKPKTIEQKPLIKKIQKTKHLIKKVSEKKENKNIKLKTIEQKPVEKIRRNALEVRKVIEQEERDLLEKENIWETPAILRKKNDFNK